MSCGGEEEEQDVADVTKRLSRLVPVLLIVTFFSFLLLELIPGDVAEQQLGINATTENVAASRRARAERPAARSVRSLGRRRRHR